MFILNLSLIVAMAPSPFTPFIKQKGYLLLDGGMATELEKLGFDLNHKLWSARILSSNPEAIRDVHLSYLEAGADCIISSGYQASIPGFMEQGSSRQKAIGLIEKAVQLAIEARDIYVLKNNPVIKPIVAAGLGPYGAYLADGSEYSGNYGISDETLYEFHQGRWNILSKSKADLIACETIPGIQEARVLHQLIRESSGTTVMLTFSCKDEKHTSDGTLLSQCTSIFKDCENVTAIGINCTSPKYINALISEANKGAPKKYIVVYPNSGEHYNAIDKIWKGTSDPTEFCLAAKGWFDLGAQVIGGCCRTGPSHIQRIRLEIE